MSLFSFSCSLKKIYIGAAGISAGMLLAVAAQAQNGPLRTGVDATFAPHAMIKLGGGLQGFNIDLGEELARHMGRKIDIEGAEFSGLASMQKNMTSCWPPSPLHLNAPRRCCSPKVIWTPITPS